MSNIVLYSNPATIARPADLLKVPTSYPIERRVVRLARVVDAIQDLRNEWAAFAIANNVSLDEVTVPVANMLDELVNLLELSGVEDARGLVGLPQVDTSGLRVVPGWDKEEES